MSFGEYLKEQRKRAGLTQRQLAKEVARDHTYISKLENDEMLHLPSHETLWAFAGALRSNTDAMFHAAGKTPPDILSIVSRGGPELWHELRERRQS